MARQEFDQIVDYLRDTVNKALAKRFTLNAMETVKRARQHPHSGSPIGLETRRMQIAPFPYDMVYLPKVDADIYIVAFPHHRQRPGYWRNRS
jgi:plasmid stabilization system protein ParE